MSEQQPEHIDEAYWVLRQLHNFKSQPDWFINFRAIHNCRPYPDETGKIQKETNSVLDETVAIRDFRERWYGDLWAQLTAINQSTSTPANIYYAINPMLENKRKKEKSIFAGYTAFYLDLDDNKSYTKEQRWMQIWYWGQMGFEPSFVIESGHGYHVYWVFSRIVAWIEWEPVLKRMVALSGCRDKGNTFDVTRVFRLPGFQNVKNWYNGDTLPCFLAWPTDWRARERCLIYEPEHFHNFPPSELSNLQQYHNEASARTQNNPALLQETLLNIVRAAAEASRNADIQQTGQRIFGQQTTQAGPAAPGQNANQPFEPILGIVPPVDEIKWAHGHKWMKKYCKDGFQGMTQGELDNLRIKLNSQDVSASELDFRVIYHLVKSSYTHDAIREFWLRPDVRLYREDKERNNPNYFDMTFQKALSYVRASIEQNDPTKNNQDEPQVIARDNEMHVVTGDKSEMVLTGELQLNSIFVDQDAISVHEREWFDCTVLCKDPVASTGVTAYSQIVQNKAFTGVNTFKEFSHDLFRVVTNNNAHMQRVAAWLLRTYRNVPKHAFHSSIVYKDKQYIFPQYIVGKDEIKQQQSTPQNEFFAKKYPLFALFMKQPFDRQKVVALYKEHWKNVLNMHLPKVITSIIGSIVSSAIRPRLSQEAEFNGFNIPTINIRGASHTAKTETAKYLSTIMGVDKDNFIVSTSTSTFALQKLISSTNFFPIIIDEFKDDDDPMLKRQMDGIRQIVRRMYSGETIYKGRADLSYTSFKIHGGLIVLGEAALERDNNVSEFTRVVPITTDEFSPSAHVKNYLRLEHISWHETGPFLYQFLAQQDVNVLKQEFIDLKLEVVEITASFFGKENARVSHNLAVLWFGCRLFDRFVQSLDPSIPTIEQTLNPRESLVRHICDQSVQSGQTLILDKIESLPLIAGEEQPKTVVSRQVFANNELWSTIKLYGEILSNRHPILKDRFQNGAFLFREKETKSIFILTPCFESRMNTEQRCNSSALSKENCAICYSHVGERLNNLFLKQERTYEHQKE